MSGIFGAGIIPGSPRDPLAATLATFFGDPATAAAWFERLIAYTGDATTAEELLAALERSGDPASVELKLGSLLSVDISALDVSPAGFLMAGEEGFTSTLDSSYVFTVI